MKNKVAIINYGLGNLYSIQKACEYVGIPTAVTNNKDEIFQSKAIILPGVGAFGNAMESLYKLDLIDTLRLIASEGKPIFGICLGFQIMMDKSEEFGDYEGLGIISGDVVGFHRALNLVDSVRIPSVGWNSISKYHKRNDWSDSLLEDLDHNTYMYFVHSYFV